MPATNHYKPEDSAQGNRRDAHIGGQYVLRNMVFQARMQLPAGGVAVLRLIDDQRGNEPQRFRIYKKKKI